MSGLESPVPHRATGSLLPHDPAWPASRWALTAPESYVLNYVQLEDGVTAFKLAVKELVARGSLKVGLIETKGLLGRTRAESVLTMGPGAVSVTDLHWFPWSASANGWRRDPQICQRATPKGIR
jgi:hypothetical protein